MDWIYNYFTYERHARLILDMETTPEEDVSSMGDGRASTAAGDQLPAPALPDEHPASK
jgi:hypothetical protein